MAVIIEIAGKGTVSPRLARELITDFIRDNDTIFYVPMPEHRGSLTWHELTDTLENAANTVVFEKEDGDQGDILFVIDADTDADLVGEYLDAGKKVYDLSRALYPVLAYP
jgi:hypothetical protein